MGRDAQPGVHRFLAGLPAGTVLDGEFVVLSGGKPDFNQLMTREQARSPLKIKTSARAMPATYIVFDLLLIDWPVAHHLGPAKAR